MICQPFAKLFFAAKNQKSIFFNGRLRKLFKNLIIFKTYLFDSIWSQIDRVYSNFVNKVHIFTDF